MTTPYSTTPISEIGDQSHQSTIAFVKSESGLYYTQGPVQPSQIVQAASSILLEELKGKEALCKPTDSAQFLRMTLGTEKNELFCALYLDNRHRVLNFEVLFRGTIDGASVYPRVVVQQALACNAAAVIFAHNHPSQDCEPSQADKTITSRLIQALQLIDVRVLDHIIVSSTNWISLAERGLLQTVNTTQGE